MARNVFADYTLDANDEIDTINLTNVNNDVFIGFEEYIEKEYADKINADFYAKDAMETVRYAEEIFK